MMTSTSRIAENVARVRERIAVAASGVGRDANSIRIVAVSKYVDAPAAALLLSVGCQELGESRPQELWAKAGSPELAGVHWHLIGRLQRNKIRRTLPLVTLIHSVDSARLIAALDEEASTLGLIVAVLLEVNCSGESAKQGFTADNLRRLLPTLADYSRIRIQGLMTMAPLEGDVAAARNAFATLRELSEALAGECPPNVTLSELSMGMSGDFEEAVKEGATIVRIGSLLFEGVKLTA
jgi:PLP dependent protein